MHDCVLASDCVWLSRYGRRTYQILRSSGLQFPGKQCLLLAWLQNEMKTFEIKVIPCRVSTAHGNDVQQQRVASRQALPGEQVAIVIPAGMFTSHQPGADVCNHFAGEYRVDTCATPVQPETAGCLTTGVGAGVAGHGWVVDE